MIASYFSGRLGNQMFRYAFIRALWEERGGKDELVFNFRRVMAGRGSNFDDNLQHFSTLPYRTDNRSLVLHYGSAAQKWHYASYRLCEKVASVFPMKWDVLLSFQRQLLDKGILILESGDNDKQLRLPAIDKVFVNGFFENRAFFDHIRPILLKEFQPRHAALDANSSLYDAIAQCESVCVTVRRGDYLSSALRNGFYVCDESYFHRAIETMKKKIRNPLFVFFSDDIAWVRSHLSVPEGSLFERGDDPVWEKMRLMSACKHFIISNSSFSWWAQYLGQYEHKVVVSPTRWFNDPTWTSCLVDDSYVKV